MATPLATEAFHGGYAKAFGFGDGGKIIMRNSAMPGLAGVVIALAVIGLAWYVVLTLGSAQPAAAVAALTGLAGVLAALPPIIRAVHGRQ